MLGEDPDILFDCAELNRGAGLAALSAAVHILLSCCPANTCFKPHLQANAFALKEESSINIFLAGSSKRVMNYLKLSLTNCKLCARSSLIPDAVC